MPKTFGTSSSVCMKRAVFNDWSVDDGVQVPERSRNGHCCYVSIVEKLFSDMYTELRRRGSHDIPIELLHGQILATVGPEYQEFSNVWESIDENKRKRNGLFEEVFTIEKRLQTSTTGADSSAFVAHASTKKSQSVAIKTTSSKPSGSNKSTKDNRENRSCCNCGKVGHLKKNCRELKPDKSVVTDKMDSSTVDDTSGSEFSAVIVNSMRLADKWLCDSGASHHMTANKQYFATHKKSSAPVNISLAEKGTILARGSGRVNIQMLAEGKWYPSYLEDVWNVSDIGRHLFSVRSAAEHGIRVIKKHRRVMFQRGGQLVEIGG